MPERKKFSLGSSYLFKIFATGFATLFFVPLFILIAIFVLLLISYHRQVPVPFTKEQLEWIILILTAGGMFFFVNIRKIFEKIFCLSLEADNMMAGRKVDKGYISALAKDRGEISSIARAFQDMINKLEYDIEKLEGAKARLQNVIERVCKFLVSVDDFSSLVYLILEATIDALKLSKGAVFSLNEGKVYISSEIGLLGIDHNRILEKGRFLMQRAKKEKSLFTFYAPNEITDIFGLPFLCIPLVLRDNMLGIMCLGGGKDRKDFSEEEKKIVENLGVQIAVAFESASLASDKERIYFETVTALALAVEAKDAYSRGHSERVARYAVILGEELGFSEEERRTLYDAARLHDIGKIGIPESVLNKPGRLSMEERKIIERHPEIGEKIVQPLKTFRKLLPLIRHHHEFLDGSGYPDGLQGDQIPMAVRILTVADIYDALSSDRAYRKAMSFEQTKEELGKMSAAGKIDSRVSDTLLRLIEEGKI